MAQIVGVIAIAACLRWAESVSWQRRGRSLPQNVYRELGALCMMMEFCKAHFFRAL